MSRFSYDDELEKDDYEHNITNNNSYVKSSLLDRASSLEDNRTFERRVEEIVKRICKKTVEQIELKIRNSNYKIDSSGKKIIEGWSCVAKVYYTDQKFEFNYSPREFLDEWYNTYAVKNDREANIFTRKLMEEFDKEGITLIVNSKKESLKKTPLDDSLFNFFSRYNRTTIEYRFEFRW